MTLAVMHDHQLLNLFHNSLEGRLSQAMWPR
jgi:hypothetical protein